MSNASGSAKGVKSRPTLRRYARNPRTDFHIHAVRRAPLLLVVNRGGADLVTFRVSSSRGDGTAHAVSRQGDATGQSDLVALLNHKPQRVIIDFLQRPSV